MKKFYACILFGFAAYFAHTQTDTLICGVSELDDSLDVTTLPYYGNNQFLYDFSDSIDVVYGSFTPEEEFEGGFDGEVYFWIPVKAWVYNNDNGQGGIPESKVRQSIKLLNDQFNGSYNPFSQSNGHTNIQFYLKCDITYVDDSQMAQDVETPYMRSVWGSNFDRNAFNIHYVQSSIHSGGAGQPPWSFFNPFSITIVTNINYHLNEALTHETGHCLGLQHTHQYSSYDDPNNPANLHYDFNKNATPCFQESVSRSRTQAASCFEQGEIKCAVTGDLLCDTEADPGLTGSDVDLSTFTYTGGGSDLWGVPWNPNVFNIMSYGRLGYKNFFSDGQMGIMKYYTTGNGMSNPDAAVHHINEYIDVYEPDDHYIDASEIVMGNPQHRGLHAIPNDAFSQTFDYCNADWVKFTISSPKVVSIITDPVPGSPEVDTRISLLSSGLSILASNDNRNPQDNYSAILSQNLSAGTYYIKIENEGTTAGEYYLYLNDCSDFCCYQPLITNINISEINQSTGNFNIGVYAFNNETFGKSVDVDGANFGCNINAPVGFGGMGYPISGSHLELDICDEAEINVIEGDFIIGDPSDNLTAEVTLMSGSSLRLSANAKLIINEGSKLIVEHGAEFEYLNGAHIELAGPNATLEIKGKVIVGNNAEFTFSGTGRIIFDQYIWPGNEDEFWQIGDNSTFKITGPNVTMEVKKNFIPRQNDLKKFKSMSFLGITIEIHPDVEMSIGSDLNVSWTHFTQKPGTPDKTHRGLRIWHQDLVSISNCEFTNGAVGLTTVRNGANGLLTLNENLFKDNVIGLRSSGKPLKLTTVNFENNGTGWLAEAMVGQSEVHNCSFTGAANASHAIYFGGQGESWLRTNNSLFEASDIGVQVVETNYRSECCVFQNLSSNGIVVNSSDLLLNDEALNVFTSAGNSIFVVNPDPQSFYINDGFNEMFVSGGYNSTLHIEGYFGPDQDILWEPDQLDNLLISADNNKMDEVSRGNLHGAPVFINAYPPGASSSVTMDNVAIPNNLEEIDRSTCVGHGSTELPGELTFPTMMESYTTGKMIFTSNFPEDNLKDALIEAIGYISGEETEQSDSLAISYLNEILTYLDPEADPLTADDKALLNIGYMALLRALERGYYYEDFQRSGGESTEYIQPMSDVIGVIDYRLTNLESADPGYESALYKFNLDKVHVLRSGEYFEDAMIVLSERNNWASGYDLQRANYWNCVIEAERDWFAGFMEDETFFSTLSVCTGFLTDTTSGKTVINSHEKWQRPFVEENPVIRDRNSIISSVYPNPGSDYVVFELKTPVTENMKVQIADITGRTLTTADIHIRHDKAFHVVMPSLLPGMYLLTLIQGEEAIETVKWSRE